MSEDPVRVRRLRVLGLLAYVAERLEAEQNREALRSVKYLGGIADDPQLSDEASLLELQRGWAGLARAPLFDGPLVWRDDFEELIMDAAPVEAAMDEIHRILFPKRPSIFTRSPDRKRARR